MIILTAANADIAKNDAGIPYRRFGFRKVIQETLSKAAAYGYEAQVFDLGSLGLGTRYQEDSSLFQRSGYYAELRDGYKSKSLFKPRLVRQVLLERKGFVTYLDGDATLHDRIDEVEDSGYDVGVTVRKRSEVSTQWHQDHFEIVKYVNAGVVFFNYTEATMGFVERWYRLTQECQNDQQALNRLVCEDAYPPVGSVRTIDGVRIKYFPGERYNFYYFDEGFPGRVKILHFKGPVRRYYPFTWARRLQCRYLNALVSGAMRLAQRP